MSGPVRPDGVGPGLRTRGPPDSARPRPAAGRLALNEKLRTELLQIGSALGRLTDGPRRRGRRGAPQPFLLADVKPKRARKPITDPVALERRRQALAKARAARAEKLAAAREGGTGGE